jgi:hypothetical protein
MEDLADKQPIVVQSEKGKFSLWPWNTFADFQRLLRTIHPEFNFATEFNIKNGSKVVFSGEEKNWENFIKANLSSVLQLETSAKFPLHQMLPNTTLDFPKSETAVEHWKLVEEMSLELMKFRSRHHAVLKPPYLEKDCIIVVKKSENICKPWAVNTDKTTAYVIKHQLIDRAIAVIKQITECGNPTQSERVEFELDYEVKKFFILQVEFQ